MEKVDAQPGRQLSRAREREKRVVHRVGVLAGNARRWFVGVKRARVAMRGDAELRVILQGVECGALPRLWSQQRLAKGLQRESRSLARDRAISRHHDAFRFQPGFPFTVGARATLRGVKVHRTFHGIELSERW